MTDVPVRRPLAPPRAVALDFGHTIIDEHVNIVSTHEHHPDHLMPGAREALFGLTLPVAIWANTRLADATDVRRWLGRAGLTSHVTWVVTSVDAGARKPARAFFEYALQVMDMSADDVLFVGNQRNTDIAGGEGFGIRTVFLADPAYRSVDDGACDVAPSFTIATLRDLPKLVAELTSAANPNQNLNTN